MTETETAPPVSVVDTAGMKRGVRLEGRKTILEARSLCNVLNVIKRRLHTLEKHSTFTKEDGQHYQCMLEQIDQRWRAEDGTFAGRLAEVDPKMQALVSRLFNECWDLLGVLESVAVEMAPEVTEIHTRLGELRDRLAAQAADPEHTLGEALALQAALDELDAARLATWGKLHVDVGVEACTTAASPRAVSAAQAAAKGGMEGGEQTEPLSPTVAGPLEPGVGACNELLNSCYELLQGTLRTAQDVDPEMQEVYDRLRCVKNSLRKMTGWRHHTLEDLRHFQGMLATIDGARRGGVFCGDPAVGRIPHGQAAAAELLAECYDLIESLANTATDISPAMRAVHDQLEALRHRLEMAARREGVTVAELEVIQEELNNIDDQRAAHSGVFASSRLFSGGVPPGQAVCSSLLNLCYRDLHDLYACVLQESESESEVSLPAAAKRAEVTAPDAPGPVQGGSKAEE